MKDSESKDSLVNKIIETRHTLDVIKRRFMDKIATKNSKIEVLELSWLKLLDDLKKKYKYSQDPELGSFIERV